MCVCLHSECVATLCRAGLITQMTSDPPPPERNKRTFSVPDHLKSHFVLFMARNI